ncbi:TPA: hypothetical protein IEH85_RS26275, partial [Escherichia coli]
INHAHHLRGLKIVLCLNRRVRPAATFTHNVPSQLVLLIAVIGYCTAIARYHQNAVCYPVTSKLSLLTELMRVL